MVLKMINATEAKVGTNILLDGKAHTIKKVDVSISLPMNGLKESLNVGVAMAAAGYYIIKFRDIS